MTDKERKILEEDGLLYPAPNCVEYYQTVQGIAKEMADRIWKAINDKVQVVRCKDCKFYRQEIDMCDEPYSTAHNVVHEDDFCSKAERRTDE